MLRQMSGFFVCMLLVAGDASADWFDFFDMGDFFGNNRHTQSQQVYGNNQGSANGTSRSSGHSRGRGEADINMDFDLNFRAKGWGSGNSNTISRSNARVVQNLAGQFNGNWYNRAHAYGVTDTTAVPVNSHYLFPPNQRSVPYQQQGYYYPGYHSYYLPGR